MNTKPQGLQICFSGISKSKTINQLNHELFTQLWTVGGMSHHVQPHWFLKEIKVQKCDYGMGSLTKGLVKC